MSLLIGTLLIETAAAQAFGRPGRERPLLQMILNNIPALNEPGHSVGPVLTEEQNRALQEPVVQGDGQAVGRILGLVGAFTGANTDELKPIIVISFASFDEFRRVIEVVAQQIRLDQGSPESPVLLNMALNVYARVAGQGFDSSQPFGIVVQTDGVLFYPILFTPLNLNSKMGQSFQNQYAERLEDGRQVIRQEVFRWPLGRLFVQEHNGWVFIAPENLLNTLPSDPTALLEGLDRTSLMAARFDLQNMPALSTRAALTLGEMNAVAQAETEIDKALARLGIGYIRSLAEQADFLEYTFSYDEKLNDYVVTQTEIVKPNTERARLLQERKNAESCLHSFYHPAGSILASHLNMSLTEIQQKQLEIILDESIGKRLLTEEERNTVLGGAIPEQTNYFLSKEGTADSTETIESADLTDTQKLEMLFRRIGAAYYYALIGAVQSGHFDGASTWSQEHGILAAYKIADGERFKRAFDSIFEEMKSNFPDVYEKNVEKDYAEHEGFLLTSVTFRPADFIRNPFIRSVTPPRLAERETRLFLGVRDDIVCFAIGQGYEPEWVLVEAISGTNETKPVDDLFFIYSAYELGQAFLTLGQPSFFSPLRNLAAETSPQAVAYTYSEFTDTTKTITFRMSGLLTPSLWRLRDAMR